MAVGQTQYIERVANSAPAVLEGVGSLSRSLAVELHARIVSGAIPLGSWLRQDALAVDFGISRTPVREALQQLHGQGIVEIVPHRGAVVRGPTPRDIRENCEVRAELEGFAAELAARRIRDDQMARLTEARDDFAQLAELVVASRRTESHFQRLAKQWATTNERFHSTVLEAADNHQLTASVLDLAARFPRNMSFQVLWGNSRQVRVNAAEHAAIAAAILDRDGAGARAAVRDHMLSAGTHLSRWYENEVWTRADHRGAGS